LTPLLVKVDVTFLLKCKWLIVRLYYAFNTLQNDWVILKQDDLYLIDNALSIRYNLIKYLFSILKLAFILLCERIIYLFKYFQILEIKKG